MKTKKNDSIQKGMTAFWKYTAFHLCEENEELRAKVKELQSQLISYEINELSERDRIIDELKHKNDELQGILDHLENMPTGSCLERDMTGQWRHITSFGCDSKQPTLVDIAKVFILADRILPEEDNA